VPSEVGLVSGIRLLLDILEFAKVVIACLAMIIVYCILFNCVLDVRQVALVVLNQALEFSDCRFDIFVSFGHFLDGFVIVDSKKALESNLSSLWN
jgi:hypothetical protein